MWDDACVHFGIEKSSQLRALESAWDEMIVWAKDKRFIPENEEDIQCFLYRGIVNQLRTSASGPSQRLTNQEAFLTVEHLIPIVSMLAMYLSPFYEYSS